MVGGARYRRAARFGAGAVLGVTLALLGCSSDEGEPSPGSTGGVPGGGSANGGASGGSGAPAGRGGTSGAAAGSGATAGSNTAGSGTSGSPAGGSGGSTGTGGSAGGGGGPVDDFWLEFARALCHHYMNCPGEPYGGEELTLTLNDDEELCAEALRDDLLTRYPSISSLNAGVASGAFTIQEESVEACLAATARCYHANAVPPTGEIRFQDITTCREVFEGSVPADGACERDEDCAGDSRCGMSGCMGTCAPRLMGAGSSGETGALCEQDRDCAAPITGIYWATCDERECVERWVENPEGVPEGPGCGDTVFSLSPCAEDLYCEDNQCERPRPADVPCDGLSACQDGVCVMNVCTPLVVRRTAGEPCDGEAVVCDAFADLVCSGSVCTPVGMLPSGFECEGPWFRERLCGAPLTRACDGDTRD